MAYTNLPAAALVTAATTPPPSLAFFLAFLEPCRPSDGCTAEARDAGTNLALSCLAPDSERCAAPRGLYWRAGGRGRTDGRREARRLARVRGGETIRGSYDLCIVGWREVLLRSFRTRRLATGSEIARWGV